MSQSTLLSLLNEHAQQNEMEFQTYKGQAENLKTPPLATQSPHHMTIRLKLDSSLNSSPDAKADAELSSSQFSEFLQGPLLLAHDNSTIVALASDTGQIAWKFQAPASTQFAAGRLAVLGSEVVAATEDGGLYAFQFSTGKLLWYWQASENFLRMPLVYQNKLLLFRRGKGQSWQIEIFAPERRSVVGTIGPFDSELAATPLVSEDLLIFSVQDAHLEAINLQSRKVKWSTEGSSDFTCPPALLGERIYICNEDGYILSYDRSTGRHAGQIELGSKVVSPLTLTESLSIGTAVDQNNSLIAFDLKQKKRLWKYSLISGDPHQRVAEIMLTHESLKALNYQSHIRGWTVWANCHSSKICIFDLKAGALLHRIDPQHRLAGDFLLAREDIAWVPVLIDNHVTLERWIAQQTNSASPHH